MCRKIRLTRLLSALLCVFFMQNLSASVLKPNVILIITDDQSWDTLGFMRGDVHTPRIDKMAKEGLYLSDFNVTSTVCSPSRYSFLTGRFAGNGTGEKFIQEHPPGDQTQVENIGELEPDRWNLAKILQKNGYTTGFVGKSHLIHHDWFLNFKKADLETYGQDADPRDPKVNRKMQRNHQRWCEAMKPFGFDYVDGFYAANLKELKNDGLNGHNLEWTVSKALNFIEEAKDEPFFLYFSTTLHHGPAPWVGKFGLDSDIRMTGEGYVEEGFPGVMPSRDDVKRRNREAGFKDKDAFALWLDDGVGAILDKVESLGLSEETLIVFVSDHGSYRHGKATLHDYGMRVPMICLWKGQIRPGSKYDEIVANIDFAPTIMDICRIEPPEDYRFDGLSFNDPLLGSQRPIRDVLFAELGLSRAVKTKKWKYIAVRYPEDLQRKIDSGFVFKDFRGQTMKLPYLTRNSHLGYYAAEQNPHYFEADQLYDLKNDPEENDNIFSQNPEIAVEMQKALAKELARFEERPFGEFTD
jgi:arylsulfatase A-like enzyme